MTLKTGVILLKIAFHIFKYKKVILNSNNVSQYYCYCIVTSLSEQKRLSGKRKPSHHLNTSERYYSYRYNIHLTIHHISHIA